MRRRSELARAAVLVAACCLLAGSSSAYYYYTYFNSSTSPYTPIPARFDVSSLPNNTVRFFVSDQGPTALAPGDSFQALISEIRAAAGKWSGVSTSSLRLGYGGLYSAGTTESAPGIRIEFSDDIPPGLLALSAPQSFGNLVPGPNGSGGFIPVVLSVMQLPKDLSQSALGPSYSEAFFVTLVHEFGHTLGLQHTLASSVMSTLRTSAATKANPLGADDIAGISLLYPADGYLASVGSISGTVTMNGTGLNLASVVAISPSNPAIATLTNPDGTFQINGIPQGEYFVYVHPLPAPVLGEGSPDNVFYPHNSNGVFLPPDTGFATQFYPGTLDPSQAQVIPVTAGNVSAGINFSVGPAGANPVSSVRTYSYTQNTYVLGAPLVLGVQTPIAATGVGLLQSDNTLAPGLNVSMLGSAAQISNLRPYPPPTPYIAVDAMPVVPAFGPKHLLFRTPGDLYVLPAAFTVVNTPPPAISGTAATTDSHGNRAVAIAGQQFGPNTRILFDGLPATILLQAPNGLMIVTPPPAPAGYTASIVALNPDGQSSLFLSPTAPTYTYDASFAAAANTQSLTVSPKELTPGGDVTVDVQGSNTNFIDGQTTIGFGTSDVLVKQVTVLSPTHLTAVVTPSATVSTSGINVTTGLGVISQALGEQVTTTDSNQ
ncbi:MAG TPA: matrixin family metalloprotease [Bryobacteraceae bacterium]|nr:matrixin family metalloprotease [Bryobacteraceae bacterium]